MARVQLDGGVEPPPILVEIYRPVAGRRGSGGPDPRNFKGDFSDRLNPGIFVGVG